MRVRFLPEAQDGHVPRKLPEFVREVRRERTQRRKTFRDIFEPAKKISERCTESVRFDSSWEHVKQSFPAPAPPKADGIGAERILFEMGSDFLVQSPKRAG